jgi:hypothetical protein
LRTTLKRSSTWDETKEATAVDGPPQAGRLRYALPQITNPANAGCPGASYSFDRIFAEALGRFEVPILRIL